MDLTSKIDPTKKQNGHFLTVKQVKRLTPNMLRVTLQCPSITGVDESCNGAHCKLLLPQADMSADTFKKIISIRPSELDMEQRPIRRTYTVRYFRPETKEMDIDFVNHGDDGPASSWARDAKPGSFLGLLGPASPKIKEFYADWYLVAADMSALPVAGATIEAMPKNAKGLAIFEITDEADKQKILAPPGIEMHWVIHPNPHVTSIAQLLFLKQLDWPTGKIQTCIAGESSLIKQLRNYLLVEKQIPRKDTYISGYWKIGLVEDDHRLWKSTQNT